VAVRGPFAVTAVVALLALVLDQVTKAMIVAAIGPAQPASSISLIGTWFSLEYVENRGTAFGLFSGAGPVLLVAVVLTLLILAWHVVCSPQQTRIQRVAFGLVLGGALGNLTDRLRLGYVIDFVSIGWWPNFNLADSAICIGVTLLLWVWLVPAQQNLSLQSRR
jgi:signal peptidase II